MKQIQAISIWYNGTIVSATLFNMSSTNDNLSTSATFYYELYSNSLEQLATGYINMTGTDYATYSSSATSNIYAYSWGATQLNLTLV
jgi:hypothetical protein